MLKKNNQIRSVFRKKRNTSFISTSTVRRSIQPAAVAVFVLMGVPCGVMAQTLNERAAQETLRQQERERALRESQEPGKDVRLPRTSETLPDRLPDRETPCFPISEIPFSGESDGFEWALAAADPADDPATGRCLGSQGINLIMARIQNAIVARGFVTTRVVAEPQDLTSGKLALRIIPGRVRAIRFSETSDSRSNAWNAFPIKPGDLLNLRDIEQALENFKRVPTAEADFEIVPAEELGQSDIVVIWKQRFPLRLTLSVNDGGSNDTGKYLANATVSADHLLTLNDLFYVSLNQDIGGGKEGDRGTRGHTVHYSVPWGYWLLGVTQSSNRYHQTVAGINQDYLYSGTSENLEAKLSRIVYRDSAHKTTASLRTYLTQSKNFIDDTEVEVQRRRMAGWEAGLAHRAFIGEATLDGSVAYRQGTGAFAALHAPEEAFGEGTARPRLVTADASLAIPFKLGEQRVRYNVDWRAQWNRTPLVPQDRFSIGGRYTVRGFDGETVLMAERGFLVRNDLSFPLGETGQELYLGLDHGRVAGQSADQLVGRSLTGVVLGLRGNYKAFSYDVFVGGPIDKPENFTANHRTAGFNLTLSF